MPSVPSNISGSAPLYLGSFASQRGAMAQKMTDRAIQLAEKEQTRQAQERAAIMKALSFNAVEGLGRKVQEEHLRELNNLQTEFSARWIKNGRKLTDQDYLDLQHAKNAMAQKIAGYKKNVADYAYWTDAITTGKIQAHPNTLPALRKYYEEGRIGDDVTSLIRLMPNTAGYLNKFADELNRLPAPQDYKFNPETEMMETVTKSNAEDVRRKLGALTAGDQYWQEMNADPAVRRQSEADFERMVKSYEKFGQPKKPSDTDFRRYEKSQLPKVAQDDPMAQEMLKRGIDIKYLGNMRYGTDLATKFSLGDKDTWEVVKRENPNIVDIWMDESGDKFYVKKKDKDAESGTTVQEYDIDTDDEEKMKQNIAYIWNEVVPRNLKTGKSLPVGWTDAIVPNMNIKVNKASYMSDPMRAISESLDVPDKTVGVEHEDSSKEYLGRSDRKKIGGWLEQVLPKGTKISYPLSNDDSVRPIKIDGITYNLAKLEDRQKVTDMATDAEGIDRIILQGAKTEKPAEGEAHAKSANTDYSIEIHDSSRIASVHNNPGNLKYTGQKGATKGELREGTKDFYWANFDTPQAGFEALVDDIQMKKEGKTQVGSGLTGESTISDFVKKYAGENEEATESYIKFLEDNFDIKRDGKLKDYDARYLATAVARKESSTTVSQKSNESKPKTVVQDGVTYNYNETTGQYE